MVLELVDCIDVNSPTMMPYERWRAWRVSHQLVRKIYLTTQNWPKAELYGLTSQARRAAFSVPMNLAEGSAKRGSRELRRFMDMSLGSLSELAYCLRLARDLGYLSDDEWKEMDAERDHAGKLLWGLYEKVKDRR
jgi:four helix bundle protein